MQQHQLGRLYCPRCLAKKMFIGLDDPDPSAARCIDCGYQFGYAADPITGELQSVLSRDVVAAAKADLIEELAAEALVSGRSPAVARAHGLLELPPDKRREAMRPTSQGKPGWSPEQWRSFAEYQRSQGTAPSSD